MMEFGGSEVNHTKADPESDSGNNGILRASPAEAFPQWIRNLLMCSTVVMLSCPKNLVKSGPLYLDGKAI